jgi:hypothetical protein
MAESVPGSAIRSSKPALAAHLVGATQVAHEAEVRQSVNGVHFATFGETGLADLDLDRILEAVPTAIVAALKANTYYFVPLALREPAPSPATPGNRAKPRKTPPTPESAMVASAWTDEFSDAAICHRNIELGHGKRGVFISTRLLADRFALSFEFFINVAHAFVDEAGVPEAFADLAWQQALANVRGETSLDAWEDRHLALGRSANPAAEPPPPPSRRARSFGSATSWAPTSRSFGDAPSTFAANAQPTVFDEKARADYLSAAFSDAVAMYLLSLALDFDYSELREREYPLLAPAALAARLKLVADLFPPNGGYEFAVKYRRRA